MCNKANKQQTEPGTPWQPSRPRREGMEERFCFTKPCSSQFSVPLQDSEVHQAGKNRNEQKNPGVVDGMYQKLGGGSWNCRTFWQGQKVWVTAWGNGEQYRSNRGDRGAACRLWAGPGEVKLRIPGTRKQMVIGPSGLNSSSASEFSLQ